MSARYCVLLLFIVTLFSLCWGSRILVVFPVPSKSHSVLGDSIVSSLLDGGHEVTYVTAFPKEATGSRLRYVNISSGFDDVIDAIVASSSPLQDDPSPYHRLQKGMVFAQEALQHENVQDLLENPTESFDVVIAEWFFTGLLAPLASVYDCPLIWYSSSDLHWQSLRLVHEASSPAYTVDPYSRSLPARVFNVQERAYQLWLQVYLTFWSYYITHYVETPEYHKLYARAMAIRGRALPEYEPLVLNGSMLLVNSHPPLGQVIPVPHNVKYIGGHHVELPIKQLPQDLKRVLDRTKNGAILFSVDGLSEVTKRELMRVFSQLEQTVIWHAEEKSEDYPRNVHLLQRISQISVLNHVNTVMFITNGDMLSLTDAAHCGVPVIGIPALDDQFVNVDIAVVRGWALRVDQTREMAGKLQEAINEIIGNHSYRSSAKLVSTIFRRRTTPVHTELLHWVQMVVDTRGAQHLRSPAQQLPIIERLYLDIITSALMILWFLSKVIKVIKVHTRRENDDKKNK